MKYETKELMLISSVDITYTRVLYTRVLNDCKSKQCRK